MVVVNFVDGSSKNYDDSHVNFTETGIIIISQEAVIHIPYQSYKNCHFKLERSNLDMSSLDVPSIDNLHGRKG